MKEEVTNSLEEFLKSPNIYTGLILYNQKITDQYCSDKIVPALKKYVESGGRNLKWVNLNNNQIGDDGAGALQNIKLNTLALRSNPIGKNGYNALKSLFDGGKIETHITTDRGVIEKNSTMDENSQQKQYTKKTSAEEALGVVRHAKNNIQRCAEDLKKLIS